MECRLWGALTNLQREARMAEEGLRLASMTAFMENIKGYAKWISGLSGYAEFSECSFDDERRTWL